MKKIGKLLGACAPRLKIVDQTFGSATKYDQTERILQDPYGYTGKVVPGSIKVILDLMEEIEGEWDKFNSPFILIQSGVDKLVDPFLGIDFEKVCKSKDKTVIYFKDMWHAVFAEDEIPYVVEAVS